MIRLGKLCTGVHDCRILRPASSSRHGSRGAMKQMAFASVAWDKKGKVTRRKRFLGKMDQVVSWAPTGAVWCTRR